MVFKENGEDVVVFFDYENIVYSLRHSMGKNPNFEILMDKCQEYGRGVLARAYADWGRHSTVIAPLQASGFDPVYVPTYFYDNQERRARKNAVDIHIAIEAVEVMYTQPHIDTFILLTGDKDFIPLANALRRHGKKVIAIGVKGTTSPYMRQATDDFAFYHQLFEDPTSKRQEPLKKDIYKVLVDAVKKLQREEQKTVFPQVKHTMSEMLGSFNEKDYTDSKGVAFNRFKDFILEAQRLGYVKFVTTGSVNEVLLPGDNKAEDPPEQPEVETDDSSTIPPPPAEVTDTESAFELLVWAVNHAKAEGKSPRTSSIKTIMRGVHADFDEKELPNDQGENFAKFSDFARAAMSRNLVRIEGKGILMEIHPGSGTLPSSASTKLTPVQKTPDTPEPDAESDLDTKPADESAPQDEIGITPDHDTVPENGSVSEDDSIPSSDTVPTNGSAPKEEPDAAAEATQPGSSTAPAPYISDYRMRVLVIDALRSCSYPAAAHTIGEHCQNLSDQRNLNMPNRRLNQLLTVARDLGLLQKAENHDGQLNQYSFVEDSELITKFLDDEA